MQPPSLIPHLFRTEFGKITAVLCKHFGIEHLQLAEDIAGETFLAALETWPHQGLPPNPAAWLYTVAKNKAKNHFTRRQTFRDKVSPALQPPHGAGTEHDIDLSGTHITDSQLQMIFAVCHPSIPPESQIGLALRILCGFGIDEIATALLASKETINKRLFRAREKLRQEQVPIALPPPGEIGRRLDAVLATLYLLFNEGYYSESRDTVLREDLCLEAMRLTHLLLGHPATALPEVNALLALMCFHASRFPARKDANGQIVLYDEQDDSRWDQALIGQGAYLLHKASGGNRLSRYHLEAAIAYQHTIREDTPQKWQQIVRLYDQLLTVAYSPIAALNRAFALSKTLGKQAALAEAEQLALTGNHYYHTLLGELYTGVDGHKAMMHLQKAHALAKTEPDKTVIRKKMERLQG